MSGSFKVTNTVGNLRLLSQKFTHNTPTVLLFLGGTPELFQFTQGLGKQVRHTLHLDIGGFRVNFNASRRSGGYVTQSMMAQDGRLIG